MASPSPVDPTIEPGSRPPQRPPDNLPSEPESTERILHMAHPDRKSPGTDRPRLRLDTNIASTHQIPIDVAPAHSPLTAVDAERREDTSISSTESPSDRFLMVVNGGDTRSQATLPSTSSAATGDIAGTTTASGPPKANPEATAEVAETVDGDAHSRHCLRAANVCAMPMKAENSDEAPLKRVEKEACAPFALLQLRYGVTAPAGAVDALAQAFDDREKGGERQRVEAGMDSAGRLWKEHVEGLKKAQQKAAAKELARIPAALRNSDGFIWSAPAEGRRKRRKTQRFGE